MKKAIIGVWLLSLLTLAPPGFAHKSSDSYLSFDVKERELDATVEVALRDLEIAVGLDLNQDNQITWGEISRQAAQITAYLRQNIVLSQQDQPCQWQGDDVWISEKSDGNYAHFKWRLSCAQPIDSLQMDYRVLFAQDAHHRGIVTVNHAQGTQTYVLSQQNPRALLQTRQTQPWQEFSLYVREGIWHIWTGYDHVLFLLGILLPAVLRRERGRWIAVQQFKPILWDVAKLVTAFSLAHSVTLALSGLRLVQLPVPLVEAAIAVTVILAALNNLFPLIKHQYRWLMVLVFGLIHGLGFANVLLEMKLPTTSLLWVLLSFNVGVELGQLVIVLSFLPVIYLLRQWQLYGKLLYPAGSAAMMGVGVFWLVQRLA